MNLYIALIGDIRESRSLEDRAAVQSRMSSLCRQLNTTEGRYMTVSPFTVTLGDEFQALFRWPDDIWKAIFTFEAGMHPVKLRYGLGIGEVSTAINTRNAIGMDGPAFYHARAAMETLRREQQTLRVLGVTTGEGLINSALDMVSLERESWKENRIKIFADFLHGENVSPIAEKLAISEQAVYKNIRDGKMKTIDTLLKYTCRMMASTLTS